MSTEPVPGRPPRRSHRTPLRRRAVAAVCLPTALAALAATPSAVSLLSSADSADAATPVTAAAAPAAVDPTVAVQNIFGPTSAWRKKVTSAPLNKDSAAMVADLTKQVKSPYGINAAFNVWKYNSPIVKVSSTQKRITVKFDDCQHKGYTPKNLYDGTKQFVNVPIPDSALPAGGSDSALTVWSPDTDQLWDFWHAKRASDGWHACWGGRIDHLWTNPGYFTGGFGASASGLATGGVIRIDEARRGRIDHAVSIGIRDYASWKNISWPAQRSDGSSTSQSKIMMGSRFRLPKSVDVDKLGLTPLGKMIAVAAQDYGLIVTEKSGAVAIGTESGALIKAKTGKDPWTAILNGTPSYEVLANFPWSRLQALPKDYGKP